jgi:outer membrane protein assembly factor BamB
LRRRTLVGLVCALVVISGGCDWAQFGFDSGNTSFNPIEPAFTTSSVLRLTQAWSADVDTGAWVVSDGVVYTTKTREAPSPNGARAFDVVTGAQRWSTSVPRGAGPVGASSGLVYYANNGIVALDARTGATRWRAAGELLVSDGSRLFTHVKASDRSSKTVGAVGPAGTALWSVTPPAPSVAR